jgi:hypothetical protein
MSKKKKTYFVICFFCRDKFEYKAADRDHIHRVHCGGHKCRLKFLRLTDKSGYLAYLKDIRNSFMPIGRKMPVKGSKGIRQTVEYVDGKLYRLIDGVCLGLVLCRDTEDTEDSEYVSVSKDPNGLPVKYRLKTIRGLEK